MENEKTNRKGTNATNNATNVDNKTKKIFVSKKGKVLTAAIAGTLMGILSSAALRFKPKSDDAHQEDPYVDETADMKQPKDTGAEDATANAASSDKHGATTSNKVDDSARTQEDNSSTTTDESKLREEIEQQVRSEMKEEVDSLKNKISELENQIEEQSDKEEFAVIDVTSVEDGDGNKMDFIVVNENGVISGYLDIDNDGYADVKIIDYNNNEQFDLAGDAFVTLEDEMIDMRNMADLFREVGGGEIDLVDPVLPVDPEDPKWIEVDGEQQELPEHIDGGAVAEADPPTIDDFDPDYNNHADVSEFNA